MSDFIFPKPRDPETLEEMTSDIFSYELGNSNLQRYGRRGQSQNGVDVAGLVNGKVIGIQCKNHVKDTITIKEVDDEIEKSERFNPALSRYIILTTAESGVKVCSHVLKVSKERSGKGTYPVEILFWEQIQNLLSKYPDLMYRYYTNRLPVQKPEDIILKGDGIRRTFSFPDQKDRILRELQGSLCVERVDPYRASVGVTTFPDAGFDGKVDIELQIGHLFSNTDVPAESFNGAVTGIKELKTFLGDGFFAKELTLFIQTRLIVAFLLGQAFKRVTKYNLTLVSGDQVWRTYDLPFVPSEVMDSLPQINTSGAKEAVVILNIARNISDSVKEFVASWEEQPKVITTYSVGSGKISNAAHALAVSIDIVKRLKNLKDGWGMKRIHFFGAIPAPLATLIAYHLNSMCPISIYFMDQSSGEYALGGEITNDLI